MGFAFDVDLGGASAKAGGFDQGHAWVQLARVGNVVMAGIGVVVGALVASGDPLQGPVAWAVVATGLVTAGGNALNDVMDRRIDRDAHPERPIARGAVSPRGGLWFAAASFGFALVAGWWAGASVFLVVVGAQAGLLVYETRWKARGLVGNVVVGVLVAGTFVVGALAVGGVSWPVGFLAGLSLLATVGREAYKDAEDAVHDRGRETVAHRWGVEGAVRLGDGATVLAVACSPLPLLVGFGGVPFGAVVGVADALFVGAVVATSPGSAQARSKGAMVVALIAFAVGGLV